MKDNRGFATSFILFGLLILFLIVMSVLLFSLNGSSSLNSKIKNKLKNDLENPNVYNEYNFYYNGDVQIFTAPKKRTYNIQAWSTSGNFISGKISLKKGQKLYIYVGGSTYNSGNSDIRETYGAVNDTDSLNSRIMIAGYNADDSNVFNNKFSDVMKNSTTPSPSTNSNEGYVRIYYYSITASNIQIDPNSTELGESLRNKLNEINCDNVQCIIDEISSMINK